MNSLGIIGGADGPTAVFVTGQPDYGFLVTVVIVAVFVGWLIVKGRKKK